MRTDVGFFLVALGLGVEAQFAGGQQPQPFKQPYNQPNQPYNQAPPPLPGSPRGTPCGKGLAFCASDLYCKKVDTGCLDFGGSGGNCIGNCQPRGPNGATPYANGAPSVHTPPPPPPPPPTPPRPAQQGSPPRPLQPPPQSTAGSGLFGLRGQAVTPITIRLCPSNVRCERRTDVCVPSPKPSGGWFCVSAAPEQECGWVGLLNQNNRGCPVGSSCLANPRLCDRSRGDGICQSSVDGICVANNIG